MYEIFEDLIKILKNKMHGVNRLSTYVTASDDVFISYNIIYQINIYQSISPMSSLTDKFFLLIIFIQLYLIIFKLDKIFLLRNP